ncbi:uncharacterized protein [Cicer arietinum]|uniref:uncharacterized protein isoform X4 n=1 Tax=Cicer arietinum TaxID=3827 RepID=UPI003CC5F675
MELELGLKITKTIDDNASTSQYQFIKDIGPIFQSRETNTMFILTAHLKGYKKEAIDIKISKDGSKISISGEKPIQEMVMMGWVMHKKMVNVKGFNKVFKIPNGVNLDKIKANYNEEEWMLNVVMPKLVKGICGLKIGEVNEQEFDKGRLELDKNKNVNDHVSSSFEDTSLKGSKDSEFKHMKEGENIMEKMIDDSNKEINEDTIHKEVEESKLRNGESVGENIGKEEYEVMKKLELDQSVGEFIAKKIKDTNHDKESKDQKFDNTSFDKKRFDDVNRDITRGIIKNENEESKLRIEDGKLNEQESKPKMEIKDGEQECVRENDVKEGIDDAMITINKELPKNLPKSTHEESEGLNIKNMQETKDVKEEKVVKEIEYYVEKGEDGRNKRKVAAATIDGSKGFNVAKKEEQKEVMEETLVDSESLMENVEREESKEEDKIEYGIIGKLKGEGSKKIDVDTFEGDTTRDKIEKEIRNKKVDCIDELSEKENVNIGIFDGRKTQNFQDIDQTEDCAKIEKCLHRDNGEKYEKIQNTDGFKKNITKEKDKYDLQEEMSKRRLEESKAIKQDFSMKILDSPNNTKMKKLKDEGNFRKETSNGRSQESKTSIEDFSVKMLDSQDDTRMEKTTEEMNKGSSQESKRAKENFPIKMLNPQDDARDGLKETTEQKIKEIRGSIDIESTKVVSFVKKKGNGQKYENIQVDANEDLKNDITNDTTQKESQEEPKILLKVKDQQCLQEQISKERSQESKVAKEDFPMKMSDSPYDPRVGLKKEIEEKLKVIKQSINQESEKVVTFKKKNIVEEKNDNTQVEPNGGLRNEITKTTTQRESEQEPKILIKAKDKKCLQEEMSNDRSQESKDAKENFSMKMLDSHDDTKMEKIKEEMSERSSQESKTTYEDFSKNFFDSARDTNIEKIKDERYVQEEMSKGKSQENKAARGCINEENAKVVSLENEKVMEEKNDNTQVEANGGLRNDITKHTIQKESEEEPKILIKAKDQQCLQEKISKSRSQENTDAKKDFPLKILDSHDDTRMEKIKEMSKGSSQESKATNKDFPKKNFDSPKDTNMKKIKDMSKGRLQEDFPMKMLDSLDDTKKEKIKEDMSKRKSQDKKSAEEYFPISILDSSVDAIEGLKETINEKIEVTRGSIKEKNAKIVSFEKKKVMEEKNHKTQVEANGGLSNDITMDTTQKESEEEPKILIKAKDQQCMQEKMSKGISQESKDAKEGFLMKMIDSDDDSKERSRETIEKKLKEDFYFQEEMSKERSPQSMVSDFSKKILDSPNDTMMKKTKEEISEGRSQENTTALGNFSMKNLDSSKDTRMEKIKKEMSEGRSHKSNAAKEDFPKKMFVLLDDTRMEEIKDECCLQEEMSKGGSQEIKVSQEDFPIKILDSLNETRMEKIKDECKFQEEMKKGISQENKVAKEDFPTKMIDSPNDAREGLKEATKEKTKVTRWDMNEESEQVVSLDSPDDAREQLKETTNEKIKVIRDTINKESAKVVSIVEKKVKRQKNENEKTEVEKSEGLRNDITKDTIQKESNKKPKILQQCLQEEISKRRSQESSVAKEDFSMKMLDSLDDAREGLKETAEEKVKVNRETINEKSEKVVSFVKKKIKGEKNEKTQVEVNESSTNDITKDTTQKESEEQPKIILKAKDQQNLQEEMSKGRNVESTSAEEFPMQIEEDSFVKRKGKEMFFNESTIKEELQGCEVERVGQNLFNVPNEKHPKFSTIVSKGFKEFEYNGNAKDNNHKTNFESKETHESKDESMKQDILNPKKQKEVGEQVVKPLLSPKQCEVEEKDKLLLCKASLELLQREDPTKDMQNLIEMKPKQRETLKPEIFEDVSQIVEREEYKTTQNVNGDKLKKQGEIIYDGDIEKVDDDKEKRNHETMKTINEKVHPIKYEIDEKEKECLEASLNNNDNAQMESQRPLEQNDYGTQEIKAPKIAPFEGANQQSINEEKRKIEHVIEAIKESPKINNEESEGNDDSFKPHVLEEALDECELKGAKNLIENSGQQYVHYKKTYQTPKGVEENDLNKKEETLIKKVEKKKTNESTKPKLEYEIPKVEEVEEEEEEEKEEERNIHVLEATISKEEDKVEQKGLNKFAPLKEPFHSLDEVAQQSKLSNSSCTQQFEVEREEEKTKKKDSKIDIQESTKIETGQEVEQCTTNKDEEAKHGIEEIDESYDEVLEEQKECKDETSEGKKDNPKISKKLLVPLVIAGFVTLVVFFVRLRRARKRYNVR